MATQARDILDPKCPAHKHFLTWLRGQTPTKRKAREFLQKFPAYKGE